MTFIGARQLASNFSVDVEAWYTDRTQGILDIFEPLPASHDYDTQIIVRGNRAIGPKLTMSVESGYFTRSGTTTYDGWWVGLRGSWIPDFGR